RKGATSGLTPAQMERAQQVEAVRRQFAHLEQLHRTEFTQPTRESVTSPALPKFAKLLATAEKQALKGVGLLDRRSRKSARTRARQRAESWRRAVMARAESERERGQREIDLRWAGLHANDPAVVVPMLTAAF